MSRDTMDLAAVKRGAQFIHSLPDQAPEHVKAAAENCGPETCRDLQALLEAATWIDDLDDDFYDTLCGSDDHLNYIGVTAAEILAHRNVTAAIDVIAQFLNALERNDGASVGSNYGSEMIALFQADAAVPFLDKVVSSTLGVNAEGIIAEGVKLLGDKYPEVRPALQPLIIQGLQQARNHDPAVNAELMFTAVQWHMTAAAEVIERAFADNLIDCGFAGDWEVIRQDLQVEGLGLPMPEHPVNSITDLRESFGIGTFSKVRLFDDDGELDEEAVEDYLDNACNAFAESDEWKQLVDNEEEAYPYNVESFLRFGVDYLGVHVNDLTPGNAEEILLELYPRKMSMDASDSDFVIDTLGAFWTYCDRVHRVRCAAEIAEQIKALKSDFHEALGDESKFGMAKSMFTMGSKAGFDMTSQRGMNEFMAAYNQSIAAGHAGRIDPPQALRPPSTLTRKQRKKELAKVKKGKKK